MRFTPIIIFSGVLALASCSPSEQSVASPDGAIRFTVQNTKDGLFYSVSDGGETVVSPSRLGFVLAGGEKVCDFKILGTTESASDTTWETAWGESRIVRDNHRQLTVEMKEKNSNLLVNLQVRVFDDGFGYRYVFPAQDRDSLVIMQELSEFRIPAGSTAWGIPANCNFYEDYYYHKNIVDLDTVSTPLAIETPGRYLAIHEAALTDYPKMNLVATDSTTLSAQLVLWSNGVAAYEKTPFATPWRTMIIGDKPGDLITSYMMLNLNEPQAIEDASWCKPMKYIGIWWEMHLRKGTWINGPKHSATTANTKRYIDFAAANGIPGVLVEGWNDGWDGHYDKADFVKPYPDYDIDEIARYAAKKGVRMIGHHETGACIRNYENQLDTAFRFLVEHGIHDVKTGYAGTPFDGTEHHSSQHGVRHYRKVIETAAKYGVTVNNHEPVMPTGLQRTYPNLMSQEGVRGQEWSAWGADGGNIPEHTVVLPFTRGLAGPMDYTFGTFNFENENHPGTRVQSTICKELALYVVIYAPLQMASDLPENYAKHPDAFQFIRDVPVDWEKTVVVDAKIGDYIVTARRDRNSADWFLGAVTDEEARDLDVALDFLEPGATYEATIYADAPDADWKTNPTAYTINKTDVTAGDKLHLHLATSGGTAISFHKK